LLTRALSGDRAAFAALVRAHQRPVFSLALRMLADRHGAEDLAQEVFLQLYRNLSAVSSEAHLAFWLRKVTMHRAIDRLRRAPRYESAAPEELEAIVPSLEIPMVERFEVRPALGGPPFGGASEALTGGWLRFAEPQPLDAPALAMYADGWLPSAWTRLTRPAGAPTVDLTVHFRAPGAALAVVEEPVLAVFRSSTASAGFFEEDGELWSRNGELLVHSRQLAIVL